MPGHFPSTTKSLFACIENLFIAGCFLSLATFQSPAATTNNASESVCDSFKRLFCTPKTNFTVRADVVPLRDGSSISSWFAQTTHVDAKLRDGYTLYRLLQDPELPPTRTNVLKTIVSTPDRLSIIEGDYVEESSPLEQDLNYSQLSAARRDALTIANMGIPDLDETSVKWDNNHFSAKRRTPKAGYDGELEISPAGVPKSLTLFQTGEQTSSIRIEYLFLDDGNGVNSPLDAVPVECHISRIGKRSSTIETIYIRAYSVENTGIDSREFDPRANVPPNAKFFIYTNDVRIPKSPEGQRR